MARHSPLMGFNQNVHRRGAVFHVQTEDWGVDRHQIVTQLFTGSGQILQRKVTNYEEHLGSEKLTETVHQLMRDQHRAMYDALKSGALDTVLDERIPKSVRRPKKSEPPPSSAKKKSEAPPKKKTSIPPPKKSSLPPKKKSEAPVAMPRRSSLPPNKKKKKRNGRSEHPSMQPQRRSSRPAAELRSSQSPQAKKSSLPPKRSEAPIKKSSLPPKRSDAAALRGVEAPVAIRASRPPVQAVARTEESPSSARPALPPPASDAKGPGSAPQSLEELAWGKMMRGFAARGVAKPAPAPDENAPKKSTPPRKSSKVPPPSDETSMRAVDWFDRGLKLATKKDFPGALRAWEKALELDPENKGYASNLRRARKKLGLPEDGSPPATASSEESEKKVKLGQEGEPREGEG